MIFFTKLLRFFSQHEAVEAVRKDMISLSDLVLQSLQNKGLKCRVFHPHEFIKGDKAYFLGELNEIFEIVTEQKVPILHGDVVDVIGDQSFGILSGDHIGK